jgi:hypothetical protein
MCYLVFFENGENGISVPILNCFQEKGLQIFGPNPFWGPFTRYLKMYAKEVDKNRYYKLTNGSGWAYSLDLDDLQLVHVLNRCFPNFWIITDQKETTFDLHILEDIRLGHSPNFNVMDTLFEQLSLCFPYSIFPWGDGNGQSCFGYITRNYDLADKFEESAFDASYGFEKDSFKSTIAVKYSKIKTSFREYCIAMLFDDSKNDSWKKSFYSEFDLHVQIPYLIGPPEISQDFPRGELEEVDKGLCKIQSLDAFIKVCNWGVHSRKDLFICPFNTLEGTLHEILVSSKESCFLWDTKFTENVDWLLTSGRSGGDNCHLNFIAQKREIFEKSLSIIENDTNAIELVSCF